MDDLKKAPPLKGLKSNFAHAVLRAVCRRAITKMEGLSDFNSERFLRPSSRRSQTESYAMLMKLTFTAKRRALRVKACPFLPFPTPCRVSASLCRKGAGSEKMKKQQSTAANPSRALGFDAFQLWVLLSPSSQGRLLRIHVTSLRCIRLGAFLSTACLILVNLHHCAS